MTAGARAAGLLAALAVAIGTRWASTVPVATQGADAATLRLTWSARPERLEICRLATDDELARMPVHMRQPTICSGESAAYRLEVRRDDRVLLRETVRGGGWRHDRPVHVFHELAQPAGSAEIEVTFERIEAAPVEHTVRRPNAAALQTAELPARLELEEQIAFRPGGVVLVTYDPARRTLVTR